MVPHVHVVGDSTSPSIDIVQSPGAIDGVGSAVSTGQVVPASYWPGGNLGSRARLVKPRVTVLVIVTPS